jgi:acyl-CoA synthetase (AMP-forming)/AMP-acid ligase II/thioesterase domain-containing protein/acyl carrier protein
VSDTQSYPAEEAAPETRPITLGEAIRRRAEAHPDHPALVASGYAPLTYSALQSQFDEVRGRLRGAGLGCSARVGVMLPNGPEAVLTIVAVACCAVAVPIDPRLTPAELEQRLRILGLDAVVVPQAAAVEARHTAQGLKIAVIDAIPCAGGRLALRLALPASGTAHASDEPDPDAPAFILQTSGTTAQPKLIPFSHRNMLAAAARIQAWFGVTPQDRCLSVSPPYYSHGLKLTVFTPLLTGGSIALPANAALVDPFEWFDALRPTWYSASPAVHRAVVEKAGPGADEPPMHTLRLIVSGGAPLQREVHDGLRAAFAVPVLEHYGSSEAAQMAANLPAPGRNKPGTCGMPQAGTMMIAGEDGTPLPPGQQGEVWVRGPTLTAGYLGDPELNRRAFEGGWFKTGDLGSLDEEGFLTLHGRLGEIINRGGEKISPVEVDAALMRHPAVAEAAAFALPHPRLGEDVAAAVVLRPDAAATPAELRHFLQENLASFKVPRRVVILDQLPKGLTGKVQRRRLAEAARASADEAPALLSPAAGQRPTSLEAELLKLWRRLLKSESIQVDDDFFESGGDSLLATEMLIETEALVGRPIPEGVLLEAATIRELASRLEDQAPSAAKPLIHFHAGGGRTPLVFFHGDLEKGGLYLRQMLRLLGTGQPVIAVTPHGLGGEAVPPTIEAMALDRLPLILAEQPRGPFRLIGNCNGALVAFEVARLLTKAGHEVEVVALIDPPTVNARPVTRAILRLLHRTGSSRWLAPAYDHLARLERAARMPAARMLSKAGQRVARGDIRFSTQSWQASYNAAMGRYLPLPLAVPAIFYAAAHDGRAWRRMSPDLEIVEVPGGHIGCLTVHASVLISHLQQRLAPASQMAA